MQQQTLDEKMPLADSYFRKGQVGSWQEGMDEELAAARRIAWAIHRVSPYTPWESNCFPQALTAKLLLRRRGIPSTLYLGAAFKEDRSGMEAHAWLRCGPMYVTGGKGDEKFGTVGVFGE